MSIDHDEAARIATGYGVTYTSPSDAAVRLVFDAYLDAMARNDAWIRDVMLKAIYLGRTVNLRGVLSTQDAHRIIEDVLRSVSKRTHHD